MGLRVSVCEVALWHFITVYTADGQDTNVRNFHIAQQTNTHITFSWDIVDGLDTSRYIESFTFYFRQRSNPSSSSSFVSPTYDATIKTNGGRTFSYTITLADHTLFGPYVMWIRVNRRTLPLYTYSEQISVVIGKHIVYIMRRKYVATQSIDYVWHHACRWSYNGAEYTAVAIWTLLWVQCELVTVLMKINNIRLICVYSVLF